MTNESGIANNHHNTVGYKTEHKKNKSSKIIQHSGLIYRNSIVNSI